MTRGSASRYGAAFGATKHFTASSHLPSPEVNVIFDFLILIFSFFFFFNIPINRSELSEPQSNLVDSDEFTHLASSFSIRKDNDLNLLFGSKATELVEA